MSDDLDLEKGDHARAERIAAEGTARSRSKRGGRSGDSGGSGSSGSRPRRSGTSDTGLAERLDGAFARLAEQLEAREDHELAEAIREDAQAMSKGLVSLTRTVTFLRYPLLVVLNFLEPVLAFWHVGRILARRFVERRQRVMAEREAAMEEQRQAAEAAGMAAA